VRPAGALGGFTLLEMMIVITIVAILTVVGLPAMRDLVKNQRLKSASLDLYGSLALARSEAIKRNVDTVIIAAPSGWQAGWSVCVDVDASKHCNTGDVILQTQDAIESSVTLTGPSNTALADGTNNPSGYAVAFSRSGRLLTTSPVQSVDFRIIASTNSRTTPMRCVDIDVSGRPRTRADSNAVDSDGCN